MLLQFRKEPIRISSSPLDLKAFVFLLLTADFYHLLCKLYLCRSREQLKQAYFVSMEVRKQGKSSKNVVSRKFRAREKKGCYTYFLAQKTEVCSLERQKMGALNFPSLERAMHCTHTSCVQKRKVLLAVEVVNLYIKAFPFMHSGQK